MKLKRKTPVFICLILICRSKCLEKNETTVALCLPLCAAPHCDLGRRHARSGRNSLLGLILLIFGMMKCAADRALSKLSFWPQQR